MLTLRRYLSFSLGTRLQRFPADFGAVVRGKGGIPRPGLVSLWETKQFAMEIVHLQMSYDDLPIKNGDLPVKKW